MYQRFWILINQFSIPLEYREMMKRRIHHTLIGFQKCTKIHINTNFCGFMEVFDKALNFNIITSIKSFHFLSFTQVFLTKKLKADSGRSSLTLSFTKKKNGNRRYKVLGLGREGPYFVTEHSSSNIYTEDIIINMLEFLVDNNSLSWYSGERFSNR